MGLEQLRRALEGSARQFYEGIASFARLILFDKRGIGMSDRAAGIPDLEFLANGICSRSIQA